MTTKNILFIHGFRGGPSGFTTIRKYLPHQWRVEIPTIPPSGDQALPQYDIDQYVDFVVHYIHKHHLKKPTLIGHSMGSIIAAAVAERHPELIDKKLILLAPITQSVMGWIRQITPLITLMPHRFVTYATNTFVYVRHQDRELYRQILQIAGADAIRCTSKKDVAAAAKFSCSHTVNEFQPPQKICVIAGAQDKLTTSAATKQFADKNHAQLHMLENTGHLLNYEDPKIVAQLITDFLT